MASHFDLAPRLAALQAQGLEVASDYHGSPAKWLQEALQDVDARVINVKGIKADDVPVMVRLSFLERLLATVEASLVEANAETPWKPNFRGNPMEVESP